MPSNDQRPTPRRTILGTLAIFFALNAIGFWLWPPATNMGLEWQSACSRFAPILAVLWLAYNELKRFPKWVWIALPITLFIIVRWPMRTFLFGVPIALLFALLKVRWKIR